MAAGPPQGRKMDRGREAVSGTSVHAAGGSAVICQGGRALGQRLSRIPSFPKKERAGGGPALPGVKRIVDSPHLRPHLRSPLTPPREGRRAPAQCVPKEDYAVPPNGSSQENSRSSG